VVKLVISLMVAMLSAMRALGVDRKMMQPIRKLMVSPIVLLAF
jgi:hypothetical protein